MGNQIVNNIEESETVTIDEELNALLEEDDDYDESVIISQIEETIRRYGYIDITNENDGSVKRHITIEFVIGEYEHMSNLYWTEGNLHYGYIPTDEELNALPEDLPEEEVGEDVVVVVDNSNLILNIFDCITEL